LQLSSKSDDGMTSQPGTPTVLPNHLSAHVPSLGTV